MLYIIDFVKKKTYHNHNVCTHQISRTKNCTPVRNKILLHYMQPFYIIIVTAIKKWNNKVTIKQNKI